MVSEMVNSPFCSKYCFVHVQIWPEHYLFGLLRLNIYEVWIDEVPL